MTEVTPAGLIRFVSESFGGRASDKAIFCYSGILRRLESTRDAVMVDRGFLIDDECTQITRCVYSASVTARTVADYTSRVRSPRHADATSYVTHIDGT